MTKLSERLAEVRKQKEEEENATNAQEVYDHHHGVASVLLDELLAASRMVYMLDANDMLLEDFDITKFDQELSEELIELLRQSVKDLREEADDSDDSKKTGKIRALASKAKAKLDRIP